MSLKMTQAQLIVFKRGKNMTRWATDIEANNLLNENSIDYTAVPYKLMDSFKIHCIGLVDMDSDREILLEGDDCCQQFFDTIKEGDSLIFHNGINYDLLAIKLFADIEYTIGPDTFGGKNVIHEDTMIMSKTLNPDRHKGHSLAAWGERLKFAKTDWRAEAVELGLIQKSDPKGAEFEIYHPRMGEYCLQDCRVTKMAHQKMINEWGKWAWSEAYEVEKKIAEIVTRQAHRGFYFDIDLARDNVVECDEIMENHRSLIEPLLPTKAITKTALAAGTMNPTPFKKDIVSSPPKSQFLKSGQPNTAIQKFVEKNDPDNGKITGEFPDFVAHIQGVEYELPMTHEFVTKGEPDANAFKFCAKHGGTLIKETREDEGTGDIIEEWVTTLYGNRLVLPVLEPVVPLSVPATMADQTHIKNWLVGLGWVPTSWSDKDLTMDSKKKKLTEEKFQAAVERYVEQTLSTNFAKYRCEHIGVSRNSLRGKLMGHDMSKPLKVLTNPEFSVGQEKEVCPNLKHIVDFPYGKEMTEYLTYRHRRNSILGGGAESYGADDEMEKGFLGQDRIFTDHRISTPADTCGCNTTRFQHKQVANIPRVSSLFGTEMRSMFGCDPNTYQLGYDADSLEAMIEAHYCTPYDPTGEYVASLIQPKPHDCHTILSQYLTEMLGEEFTRNSAKSVKYACAYGAQPYRLSVDNGWSLSIAKDVFNGYWEKAAPLARLKTRLEGYWENVGKKKFILGIDGRKIFVRSKHSLVNALFQSAGVICMKRAMVIHNERMQKEGLIVDFFNDDWKATSYVQQMMAYHDEAQEEVSKDLVDFHMFETEEEAKNFKIEGKHLGDLQEAPDGRFFRAYCISGQSASDSLTEASEFYKLRVKLTAGYMIGRNWAECH